MWMRRNSKVCFSKAINSRSVCFSSHSLLAFVNSELYKTFKWRNEQKLKEDIYGQEEYGVSLPSVSLVQVSPLGDNSVCKVADCTTEMTQSQSPSGLWTQPLFQPLFPCCQGTVHKSPINNDRHLFVWDDRLWVAIKKDSSRTAINGTFIMRDEWKKGGSVTWQRKII